MPRRRPKALRTERWRPRKDVQIRRIRSVSALTRVAIRRLEERSLGLNTVAALLSWYESGFNGVTSLWDPEIETVRNHLAEIMLCLPARARAELEQRLKRMDEALERHLVSAPDEHAWLFEPVGKVRHRPNQD